MRELNIPERVNGRIIQTLKAIEESLPAALQRLAQYIITHQNDMSTLNVTDLAHASDVGEATVVRLAKLLKFPGFKEFQFELLRELAVQNQHVGEDKILDSNIGDKDDCFVIARKLKLAVSRSLSENIKSVDQQTLESVADAIYKARKVFIIGVGNSCLSAVFFKNKLCRIGIDAMCEMMTHYMYTSLAMLGPSDVVIAISQKGGSYETLKAFQIGKETGALSIAITNNPVGQLASLADLVIYNGNEEGTLQGDSVATIAAQLHVCEIIYTMVVAANRTKAVKTKQKTLNALSKMVNQN